MNTTEKNKLIAEFMGFEYEKSPLELEIQRCLNNGLIKKPFVESLNYHTSWDWLIPVINKIINTDTLAQRRQNVYGSITPDISKSYKAVVEFIKWYNENKED